MNALLAAATPASWFAVAAERLDELLLDHASCEKKAASTALALLFSYPEASADNARLARLAREELRHFEQVESLRIALGIPFRRLKPSRYASGLRATLRSAEPERRIDLLLLGAFIEARSCERFAGLVHVLPERVAALYRQLQDSEARHANVYLQLAQRANDAAGGNDLARRIAAVAAVEADLATQEDRQFRFHSGPPV